MRITKNQLRQIIKEELAAVLREDDKEDEGPGVKGDVEALPAASATEKAGAKGRAEMEKRPLFKGRDVKAIKRDQPEKEEMVDYSPKITSRD